MKKLVFIKDFILDLFIHRDQINPNATEDAIKIIINIGNKNKIEITMVDLTNLQAAADKLAALMDVTTALFHSMKDQKANTVDPTQIKSLEDKLNLSVNQLTAINNAQDPSSPSATQTTAV